MKFSRRSGFIPFLVGVLLTVSAGWFFLWTLSSAGLRCVACGCRYELTASDPYCRLPSILLILFLVTFVGAIGAFGVAWFQRKRAKRIAV